MLFRSMILLFLSSSMLYAGDISRDIRNGGVAPQGSYHLELGLAVYYLEYPVLGVAERPYEPGIGVVIDGRFQWRRLFIEAMTENERGLTFGVSVIDNEAWSLDLLASNQHNEISEDLNDELDGLADRETDFMLGLRSTLAFENTLAEVEYATDISDTHNGEIFALSLGKFWQIRNFNLHSQIGFRYTSKDITNYYVGIDPQRDIITERFPAYSVDQGSNEYKFEVGVTYPINEKWVLRSTAQSFYYSDEVMDSPLATNNNYLLLLTSISRVF